MRRRLTPVDRVGVDERAAVLGKRSIKASSQQAAIRLAISRARMPPTVVSTSRTLGAPNAK